MLSRILRLLGILPSASGAILMAMAQVSPDQAATNICKWLPQASPNCLAGIPSWFIWYVAVILVVIGVIWVSWPWPLRGVQKLGPGLLLAICAVIIFIGLAGVIGAGLWQWQSGDQSAVQTASAPQPGTVSKADYDALGRQLAEAQATHASDQTTIHNLQAQAARPQPPDQSAEVQQLKTQLSTKEEESKAKDKQISDFRDKYLLAINPNERSVPIPDPFPSGNIFPSGYMTAQNVNDLASVVDQVVVLAQRGANIARAIPDIVLTATDRGAPLGVITNVDAAIDSLSNFDKQMRDVQSQLDSITNDDHNAPYKGDIVNLIGTTRSIDLITTADLYRQLLAKVKLQGFSSPQTAFVLNQPGAYLAIQKMARARGEFLMWANGFINNRAPAAKAELAKRVK